MIGSGNNADNATCDTLKISRAVELQGSNVVVIVTLYIRGIGKSVRRVAWIGLRGEIVSSGWDLRVDLLIRWR